MHLHPSLLLTFVVLAAARDRAQTAEPDTPRAIAAIQLLLDAGIAELNGGRFDAAATDAEKAVTAAHQAHDMAGEATAHKLKAVAYEKQERPHEAVEEWKACAQAWQEANDGPDRIAALVSLLLDQPEQDQQGVGDLVNQTIAVAREDRTRPLASARMLSRQAGSCAVRGRLEVAQKLGSAALELLNVVEPDSLDVARCLSNLGVIALNRDELLTAEAHFKQALAIQQRVAPDSLDVAGSYNNLGLVARQRNDLATTEGCYKKALAIQQKVGPNSLDVARSFNNLGIVASDRGNLPAAEDYYRQALVLFRKLAPDTLDEAGILTNLGALRHDRGDPDQAESYHRQAFDIYKKRAPVSREMAACLLNLGVAARYRGDLDGDAAYQQQALDILHECAPDSIEVASGLNNLGDVALGRGDLATAESYFQQALALQEKIAPDSTYVAATFDNLGIVASERGDYATAARYHQRAYALNRKLKPDSIEVAASLSNLGDVAANRGDYAAAESYFQRALDLQQGLEPGSRDVAISLNNLGSAAMYLGRLDDADSYHLKALAIYRKLAPSSLDVAACLVSLGAVAYARRDFSASENDYAQALGIYGKFAPGSLYVADTKTQLAEFRHRSRSDAAAVPLLLDACAIVEQQRGNVRSTEGRSLLLAGHTDAFTRLASVYLALGRPDDAFHTLERARCRSLVDRLAERGIALSSSGGEQAKRQSDLDNRRRIAYAALKHDQDRIDNLQGKPGSATQLTALRTDQETAKAQIEALAAEQRTLEAEARRSDPRLAAIAYPQPLDLADARKLLARDPGTLLLCYFMDERKTYLFVVTGTTFRCYPLSISVQDLNAQVAKVRMLLSDADSSRDQYAPKLRSLYDELIRPADREVAGAKRLLICADGPLRLLPFAALMPDAHHALVESKPLHVTDSLTAYAVLRTLLETDRRARSRRVVVLADPAYDNRSPALQATLKRLPKKMGGKLEPLSQTREQARELQRLYGADTVVLLGRSATRTELLKVAGDARLLHLACHGWADDHDLFGSWLALTPRDRNDDGLLRAWEVMETLHLHADLVTLAACDTGLGTERKGEGVIGMARAFEYAGARSVLMSLWSVDEASTNDLMLAFYRCLKQGMPKDAALQQAQIVVLRRHPNPYYWAPYVLSGDRK